MPGMLRVLDLERGDAPPAPAARALDPEVVEGVRSILARVRDEGDAALDALTSRLDGADLGGRPRVEPGELPAATDRIDPALRDALGAMADRLRDLHARQLPAPWEEIRGGMRYGETVRPLHRVGSYVPGGRASYPSSVLMTVIPARVAGVAEVVLCTPPAEDGTVADPVLAAAAIAGADAVFRIGGAQAVAAMAYGTASVPAVDKIVGPGNVWVTAAKREVAGTVGIDALAGPTELVIVADDATPPDLLAVDLVAQCEHDPAARTTLVTTDRSLPDRVRDPLRREVEGSPRRGIVEEALGHAVAVLVPDLEAAAEVADGLAPEHLQVMLGDGRTFLDRVRAYGAAFLGPSTPVSLGDYGVGSNHVLPTMGTARFASGLRAADFVTVSGYTEATPEALADLGPGIETVARAEGLDAHARASELRR